MAEPLRQTSGRPDDGILEAQAQPVTNANLWYQRLHLPVRHFFMVLALAAWLVALPTGNARAGGLNDTGITDCSNDTAVVTTGVEANSGSHPRQDCRYGRDAATAFGMPKVGGGGKGFDFSKIANNGTVLDASSVLGTGATDWACTRDNVTGLIWEVKTTSGLRSSSHSYSWYSSNVATNGGTVGTASAGGCATSGRCDTEKFAADVNSAALCGATDWRMPTQNELLSVVDYGRTGPTIDPTYFPNSFDNSLWSASAVASNPNNAWSINFYNGNANFGNSKSVALQVRLVRALP